jgi:hypothetical protein
MRLLAAASFPTLFLAGLFFACGGSDQQQAGDSGPDEGAESSSEGGLLDGLPQRDTLDDAGLNCSFIKNGPGEKFDPVDFCAIQPVLANQHEYGFTAKGGTYTGWNYKSLNPILGTDEKPAHDILDDAAYAASCAAYHAWAQLYLNPPSFDADLEAITPVLEKELATLPLDYDGDLYWNLRKVARGLTAINAMVDADKIDAIADKYARQIFSTFFSSLPLAGVDAGSVEAGLDGGGTDGAADGGSSDATLPDAQAGNDAGGDPMFEGDGIIGIDQFPVTGQPGYLYEPGKVTSAAYALIDLAYRNPADPDAAKWQRAARQALDHVYDRGREPETGLYYTSLITVGGPLDALGSLSTPTNSVSTDVQATHLLYLLRAQQLVAMSIPPLDAGPDAMIPLDAPGTGTLASLADFPFLTRAVELLVALQPFWDGTVKVDGGTDSSLPVGDTTLGGFVDGYLPSTHELVRTKSTHPNAYLFAALDMQLTVAGNASPVLHQEIAERSKLRVLLSNETESMSGQIVGIKPNVNFLTVVSGQQAYFGTVSQDFHQSTTSTANDYTASAIAAVVQAFDTQLNFGFTP